LLPRHLFVLTGEFDRQVHLVRKPGNRVGLLPELGTPPRSREESLKFGVQSLSKLCFRKCFFAV